ncbi:cation-translocating P-type ATPase [Pseudaminobacter arsenicus]|uniref:P-type Cu(+) transporter n=1 Tax=Borborobacter arsenicus TaxID=1851146 RepID=A0A432V1P1_9HYPH|nr:cation-translocating P-type ATPase [Pseudaminobacter arsenicus]RUM95972.1 cation-translocating P-type ATPase [Pseudaminobacter arsenicus]
MARALSSELPGLDDAEADERLRSEGFNELPRSGHRTPLDIAIDVLREPMLTLLLAGGAVYLVLGDLKEALILIVFAGMSVTITLVQEARTERVLEALRDLTSPRALVIREGVKKRIAGREVARGDIILLGEGDRVPADARLLESRNLLADESLLTGESMPVRKIVADATHTAGARPGGDDLPYVYAGSLVVSGSGLGEVIATGPRSEIGRIGQSLHQLETEPPRLLAQTRRLVWLSAAAGGIVSTLAVVLYGLLRGGWLDAFLAGITIGMSMLPEEFPLVLAVFMAMGAWRISQARVLTRRATAIETLGSATVLCTDKTGTLTENRMSVAVLRTRRGRALHAREKPHEPLADEFREMVKYGLLASEPEPFDPMEKAFHNLARDRMAGASLSPHWKLVRTYGLRPELLAVTNVWALADGNSNVFGAAKGAPETIAELCRLGPKEVSGVKEAVETMAADGLRVLGVAKVSCPKAALPESPRDLSFEFLGLVGLADPVRPSVPAAVRQCRSAGIRILMVTGDYPATAIAIARQAGLDAEEVLTGRDLESIDDAGLMRLLRNTSTFARTMPEQKLRIVQALKADGHIVAMTGDGVNDAPSLKAANIGIAMGGRGTDVAREASSLVLLDDDFGSIVKAVRLGRRIYDNLRKAMGFIFAVHVPIAGLALLRLIFGLPIIFTPIHIAFLEMIIDPVCSLAFEAETEEKDVMDRHPRPPNDRLFSPALIGWSLLQGTLVLVLVAGIFVSTLQIGMPEDEARAVAFLSLVVSIVSLILINRSFSASLITAFRSPNPMLAWIVLAVAAIMTLSLSIPSLSALFRFAPLQWDNVTLAVVTGLIALVMLELLKPVWSERLRS